MALESAKAKLEGKFAFEDLPADRSDSIWDKIEATYKLTLQELSALKNERCKLQGYVPLLSYYWAIIIGILLCLAAYFIVGYLSRIKGFERFRRSNWVLRIQLLLAFGLILLFAACSTFDERDARLAMALLSVVAVIVSYQMKSYQSAIESCFLTIAYLCHVNISYPTFFCVKLAVTCLLSPLQHSTAMTQLRYLLFFVNAPCHAMLYYQPHTYHYRGGDTPELWKPHVKDGYLSAVTKAFYSPCVGFSLRSNHEQIMKELALCGKCHDWAAVAACLLSSQRFVTYCAVAHARLNYWCLFFVGLSLQLAFGVLGVSYQVFSVWVDCSFIICVLFDLGNAPEDLLRDPTKCWLDPFELIMYSGVVTGSIVYIYAAPLSWKFWGFYWFVGLSFACSVLLRFQKPVQISYPPPPPDQKVCVPYWAGRRCKSHCNLPHVRLYATAPLAT